MTSPDSLLDFLRSRRSVRRFRPDPVSRDTLTRLVEVACWAPSAGNRQDWLFTAVTSPQVKERMALVVREHWAEIVRSNRDLGVIAEVEAYAAHFADFATAPAVVIVSARCVDSVQRHLLADNASATVGGAASAAMAAQNLMLAAHALGLGTCCMTGALAAQDELKSILGLGRRHEMVCLIALGWPDETPPAPARKPAEEVLRFLE